MIELKNRFPQVDQKDRLSYGGDQGDHPRKLIRKYGCGVIGGADLLFYLCLYRTGCRRGLFAVQKEPRAELELYNQWVDRLSRKYLPVIPGFGMNGLVLAFGLNRYFRHNLIPMRARWCFSGRKLWKRVDAMLSDDLPVILSVGPNIPLFWGKHRLPLYKKAGEDVYIRAAQVRAHYVTVTGADGQWIQVSSWGKKYYISKKEYKEYVKKHSSYLVSNMVLLKPRKQRNGGYRKPYGPSKMKKKAGAEGAAGNREKGMP